MGVLEPCGDSDCHRCWQKRLSSNEQENSAAEGERFLCIWSPAAGYRHHWLTPPGRSLKTHLFATLLTITLRKCGLTLRFTFLISRTVGLIQGCSAYVQTFKKRLCNVMRCNMVVCCTLQMESDVMVLCGRLKAICEACSQTSPGLDSAAELHAELTAQLKLSRFVF